MMIEKKSLSVYNNEYGSKYKNGTHWWSFLNLHLRKFFFFNLTVFGLRDLKNSSSTAIEKLLPKFYSESKNF